MVGRIQKRQQVEYKKPRKINTVTVSMALFGAALFYLAYCMYPGFTVKSNVKEELRLKLLTMYRINLMPGGHKKRRTLELKNELLERVRELGVEDEDLEIELYGDEEVVWMEARFKTVVQLEGLDKSFDWHHSPHVETSAERVDW